MILKCFTGNINDWIKFYEEYLFVDIKQYDLIIITRNLFINLANIL